jgi:hypothetical protein
MIDPTRSTESVGQPEQVTYIPICMEEIVAIGRFSAHDGFCPRSGEGRLSFSKPPDQ